MSTTEVHYAILDVVKKRLNIADADITLDDYIEIFMSDADNYINNMLRRKLGSYDSNRRFIPLPLTTTTIPPLEPELITRATALTVGMVRQEMSNDNNLFNTAVTDLNEYLNGQFGFTRDVPFQVIPSITISPINGPSGAVITITGIQFAPNRLISISFSGVQVTTTPATAFTDVNGSFTGVTFTMPSNLVKGPYIIVVTDGIVGPFIISGQVTNTNTFNGNFAQQYYTVTS